MIKDEYGKQPLKIRGIDKKISAQRNPRVECWLRGVGGWGDDGQGVHTESYKINEFWGSVDSMAVIVDSTPLYT